LRFTDYAGIGFLETVMITTSTLGEIPTGAIADIVGKRKAVMLAFALGALGNITMAFAPNYIVLIISIMTMTLGGAFFSGSLEALVYDTLKERKLEHTFQGVIGKMNSMQNIGMAVAGIAGGYLYQINVSLPFLMVALAYTMGVFVSFNLTEPKIDSEKYSWKIFVSQNKEGFSQLFHSNKTMWLALLFLIPSAFMVATENVVNDATVIELGYNSIGFGYFATCLYLFGTLVSVKSDWIISKLGSAYTYVTLLSIYAITLLLIPWSMIAVGTVLLLLRYGVQTIFDNYQSVKINEIADSRYRATTLSTFNLLRNIPYVFGATGIGLLMNLYTAKTFSLYFGIVFIFIVSLVFIAKPIFEKR
jgi:MFS family permease